MNHRILIPGFVRGCPQLSLLMCFTWRLEPAYKGAMLSTGTGMSETTTLSGLLAGGLGS